MSNKGQGINDLINTSLNHISRFLKTFWSFFLIFATITLVFIVIDKNIVLDRLVNFIVLIPVIIWMIAGLILETLSIIALGDLITNLQLSNDSRSDSLLNKARNMRFYLIVDLALTILVVFKISATLMYLKFKKESAKLNTMLES